jgi:glycosyltransferase involved in cell wall biosynthesis
MKLDASLVICTRNRATQLKTCLEYVARQQPSCSWELVVVDNGSSDGTAGLLTEYAAAVGFPVATAFEGIPGLGRARNAGWTAARGEIITFTDDDCYVAPDYMDRACETFADPKIGFAGGRIDLFDPADYPATIRTDPQPQLIEPRSFIAAGLLQGANMMFRRRVLEAIDGFDSDLGPGNRFYGEDMDAQARASYAGWWGLYTPKVVVAHHHRRTEQDMPALRRAYALGRGAYKTKCILNHEMRSAYIRVWYWQFRHVFTGSPQSRRELAWEMNGAAGYLADRLRKRVSGANR